MNGALPPPVERVPCEKKHYGSADPVIIASIMRPHFANVKKMSAVVHGLAIDIPMSIIILSCCLATTSDDRDRRDTSTTAP